MKWKAIVGNGKSLFKRVKMIEINEKDCYARGMNNKEWERTVGFENPLLIAKRSSPNLGRDDYV